MQSQYLYLLLQGCHLATEGLLLLLGAGWGRLLQLQSLLQCKDFFGQICDLVRGGDPVSGHAELGRDQGPLHLSWEAWHRVTNSTKDLN